MKSSDAFPSKFISAADLQGQEAVVKITHVTTDEIGGKQKYVCFFAGKQKGLVLNKTNWNTIVRITGMEDSDDWTGAQVCLYEAMVDFQGDQVPAVRIKAVPKAGAAPAQQQRKVAPAQVQGGGGDDMNDSIPFAAEWR